jgi:hypothetical protein
MRSLMINTVLSREQCTLKKNNMRKSKATKEMSLYRYFLTRSLEVFFALAAARQHRDGS